ncbi:MAG: glutamate racemase [Lachnospiraceae bacterium]|nr:glutamate racemase [Lachnospiraceae bacterium]
MTDNNAPIGVFDSGVGGLTVFREIMRQLPNERIVYFGDTARVPYGSKSPETVTRYSEQIVNFLKTLNVKAIVVACNTASALAMEEIENKYDIPMIEVVKPGAKAAAEATQNNRIGVIATEATIKSNIYCRYIKNLNNEISVTGKACPLFVPLVEEGLLNDPVTIDIAGRYLNDLIKIDIDTLILGCTHYPLLHETITRIMGGKVALINPAYETARKLKDLLTDLNLLTENKTLKDASHSHRLYVSDSAEKFKIFANTIINYRNLTTKTINIEEY